MKAISTFLARRMSPCSEMDFLTAFISLQLCTTDCSCAGIRKCCPLLYAEESNILDPNYVGPKACMPAASRPEVAQMAKIMVRSSLAINT